MLGRVTPLFYARARAGLCLDASSEANVNFALPFEVEYLEHVMIVQGSCNDR